MSEALLGQYDSLQYTEEEVDEAISRRLNLDEHPDVRADLERFPKERVAYILSRHSAVDGIVSGKFIDKLEERGLLVRWADEVVIPNTIPVDKPGWYDVEIAWMEENAPDLVSERKAHRQWQHERMLEWAKIWELQQDETKGETDKSAGGKMVDEPSNKTEDKMDEK